MKTLFNKTALGADIGERAIKLTRLSKKNGRVFLEACYMQDLAEQNPRYPALRPVEDRLSAIVEINELRGTRAHASLADRKLNSFDMTLPPMPRRELEAAVRNEVEGKLTYPFEEACVDFVTESSGDSKAKSLHVRAVCARRSDVEERIQALQNAQLIPESIESDVLAVAETLEFNGYLDACANCVVIDLGESATSIAHFLKGKLRSVNVVDLGARQLNLTVAAKLAVTYSEAAREVQSASRNDEIDAIVIEHNQQLLGNISPFVLEIREMSFAGAIDRIFLVGGASQDEQLRLLIEDSFGVTTERVDPFRGIEIFRAGKDQDSSAAELAPYMSVAVGLALRGLP